MRKYLCLLLVGSIIFFGCRKTTIKDYTVVIKPIGPSDFTRSTFYISLKKTDFKKENPFTYEILTDENSLQSVVSFIEEHRPIINDTINKIGWGALKISVYNANHAIIDFKLNRSDYSKNYLKLLIEWLESTNSDAKLISRLKEEGLAAIE